MSSTISVLPRAAAQSSIARGNARIEEVFRHNYGQVLRRTDRMFAVLMLVQWLSAIAVAYWLSPHAWAGLESAVHAHVYAAVLLGGLISSLPIFLALRHPGQTITRYTIASAQVLWSALLIHLSGGRIETHFHVFGSLAILAFYRDFKVLVPATVLVAADHFIRGILWPESVYGVASPEWWRFLEHAGWVLFIDAFLFINCFQSYRELWDLSKRQVEVEESREAMVRVEKLAAIGQLAASVGHELRNPLAAIRNAHTYITRRLVPEGQPSTVEPRVVEFLGIMRRELDASAKIISNLLDFSRPRTPTRTLCPLRPLVDEALSLVPRADKVTTRNEIPVDLPIPEIDKDQFRQVIMNLVQNAVEAAAADRPAVVTIGASGGGSEPWQITVTDNGPGIPAELREKIFQPLFSTKAKGTGLGLSVVAGMIERHGGTIRVDSEMGRGTTFTIELPHADLRSVSDAAE